MSDLKKYWSKRGEDYGSDIRGVLFRKPYPARFNKAFHDWTIKESEKVIGDNDVKLLDVACGYGRLSRELLKKHKTISIKGIDLSKPYVDLYNKELSPRGKAREGDMRKLPFRNKNFDVVVVIAAIMYLTSEEDLQQAISEFVRVLKKGGRMLIIERTKLMQISDLPAIIRNRGRSTQTSFTISSLSALINDAGGKVVRINYWPSKFFPLFVSLTIQR